MKTGAINLKYVVCALLVTALACAFIVPATTVTAAAADWPLQLVGAITVNMTQAEFEALASSHPASWDDSATGNLWSGVALWRLAALVDDSDNTTFNDALAATGYEVEVIGADGYSYTFASADIALVDNIIMANQLNSVALPAGKYPLKLVSPTFDVGGLSVATVVKIELHGTSVTRPVPTVAGWPLQLYGAQTDNMTQTAFAANVSTNGLTCADDAGNWSGLALWRLAALIDDNDPLTFNSTLATQEYSIKVSSPDYYYIFNSADIAGNDNIIVANTLEGQPLAATGPGNSTKLLYPLKLVGSGLHSGDRVGGIVMIELLGLLTPTPTPTPTPSPTLWDLNNDHICNIGDVVKIGLQWDKTGSGGWIAEDLNKDGIINIGDVVVLGLHWGQTW